jgi:hypothetical protein
METIRKDVVGFEGIYRVSNFGAVERCDGYHKLPKPLKPHKDKKGYLNVSLSKNCKGYSFRVHTIVAYAFLGPRPDGLEINHIDGNKQNNTPSNLEYVTHEYNMHHANNVICVITPTRARGCRNGRATKPGKVLRGDAHKSSKLTEDKVRIVLGLLDEGVLEQKAIAKIVGISETQIWRIKTKQSWAHVTL